MRNEYMQKKAILNWDTTKITAWAEEDHLLGFGGELGRGRADADDPLDGETKAIEKDLNEVEAHKKSAMKASPRRSTTDKMNAHWLEGLEVWCSLLDRFVG